jgi:protein-tyrosine phosphatase
MKGYVDLHCHFVAGVDDGVRTAEEGIRLLRNLKGAGFDYVIATPHMRPGMFDNTREGLEAAYVEFRSALPGAHEVPETGLASEHYFDDVVFSRLLAGQSLPYPGGRAVLLEFYEIDFPVSVAQRFFELQRRRLLPVIAHPERYRFLWDSTAKLERLVELGAVALLDAAALVGKYGRKPKRCAEQLLEKGVYQAACTDAHRPDDVDEVKEAMRVIEKRYGEEELDYLFRRGPRAILEGTQT